jgi:hypothetical protein
MIDTALATSVLQPVGKGVIDRLKAFLGVIEGMGADTQPAEKRQNDSKGDHRRYHKKIFLANFGNDSVSGIGDQVTVSCPLTSCIGYSETV